MTDQPSACIKCGSARHRVAYHNGPKGNARARIRYCPEGRPDGEHLCVECEGCGFRWWKNCVSKVAAERERADQILKDAAIAYESQSAAIAAAEKRAAYFEEAGIEAQRERDAAEKQAERMREALEQIRMMAIHDGRGWMDFTRIEKIALATLDKEKP